MEEKEIPANYVFTQRLRELITQLKDIQEEKMEVVKKQKYEEAAALRQREKDVDKLIYEELKIDVDGMDQRSVSDAKKILNLIEEGDVDFSNAINKLEKPDLERMILIRYAERYAKGEITKGKMHDAIAEAFKSIEADIKEKVKTNIENKIKDILWT